MLTVLVLSLSLALVQTVASAASEPEFWAEDSGELIQNGAVDAPVCLDGVSLFSVDVRTQLATVISEGIKQGATEIDISAFDLRPDNEEHRGILRDAFSMAGNANPEVFYLSSQFGMYGYSDLITSIVLQYNPVTEEQKEVFNQKIEEALSEIQEGMTTEEKLVVLHDYLVRNVVYNWTVATTGSSVNVDQSVFDAYGALVNGDAVCQGYACAYAALLNRIGVPNLPVQRIP